MLEARPRAFPARTWRTKSQRKPFFEQAATMTTVMTMIAAWPPGVSAS
ncbi:hypothetical protein ABZ341_43520 [Streptomyces sp. NPDC006173]